MKIKKVSLFLVVICSLILSGCGQAGVDQSGTMEQDRKQEQVQNESFSGSLKELLGLGKKVECSWQFEDPESKVSTSGLVWVDGNRSRSEIRVEGTGESDMNMIQVSDGEISYMWNQGQKSGSKFNIAEMEKIGKEMETDQTDQDENYQNKAQSNWEKMYNYKCKAWRVDESKFSIPTDVEFTDMVEQMQQMQEQTENMKQNMAGVCNMLPEPQKSECEESLK